MFSLLLHIESPSCQESLPPNQCPHARVSSDWPITPSSTICMNDFRPGSSSKVPCLRNPVFHAAFGVYRVSPIQCVLACFNGFMPSLLPRLDSTPFQYWAISSRRAAPLPVPDVLFTQCRPEHYPRCFRLNSCSVMSRFPCPIEYHACNAFNV